MNTLQKTKFAGKSVLLFLLSFGAAFAAPSRDWSQWMSHYYEAPQPDQVVSAVYGLSQTGYFSEADHRTAPSDSSLVCFPRTPIASKAGCRHFAIYPRPISV
jgi:hypothetical protein